MLISIIVNFVPIIIAIVLHEIAHGYVAYKCGDDTAKKLKRLSFNPIYHISPVGTIIIPTLLLLSKTGFIFGWAKPVPVDFNNLRHPKRDTLIVASAGIVTNILLAIISALLLKLAPYIDHKLTHGIITLFLINMVIFNIVLAVFNSLPIPPLDGSKILLGWSKNKYIQKFLNSYRQGTIFIILIAFIIPMFARYFGYNFNPFGYYMIKVSRTIIGWLI
ncbi:MAG: site-2 protease family protein [Alphaproteobacteria bacterium]|nr:site-2 protease family protein [Alphaproteobacteria bacterium]